MNGSVLVVDSDQPSPSTDHSAQPLRLVLPKNGDFHYWFQQTDKFRIIADSDATSGDIRIVDARSTDDLPVIDPDYPALVVVDPHYIEPIIDSLLSNLRSDSFEVITEAELEGPSLLLRLRLLQSRFASRPSATDDIVRENAYTVLQAVMRVSNDWMVLKGLDNTFLLASKYVCKTFELSETEILGKNDLEVGTPAELVLGKSGTDWIGYWEMDKRLTDKGESVVLEPLVISDNEQHMYRESTIKMSLKDRHGKVFGLLVIVSAVNNLKAETNGHNSPQDSIWAKTSTLNKSPALLEMQKEKQVLELEKQATEKAFIEKNQFVAAASHDIRQPLHALGLFIHALEQILSNDKSLLILDKIKRCHESISELLNSLLDISRLDANVVSADLTHFNIARLLDKLHDEQVEKAQGKSIDFHVYSDKSIVHCDEILLGRILRNLITNAINHTDDGAVTVHAQRFGAQIKIQVNDTGHGISEHQHDAIFLEHYRIDGNSAQGFGLGLAIVKRLCKLLDIKLHLNSTVGAGTQFQFLVPLGESGKQSTVDNPQLPSFLSNPKILVVDDDHRVLGAVRAVLEQHGCNVTSAESEHELIEKVRAENISSDLLLIDYRLKNNVTGVQAIDTIRSALNHHIPAIVITGDTSAEGLREIKESGQDVLHKPVLAETLLAAVNQALSINLKTQI